MARSDLSDSLAFINLSSGDRIETARSIVEACKRCGFFYLVNHGIDEAKLKEVFDQSKRFFSLPLEEKSKISQNSEHRGYTPLYSETLDSSITSIGDLKESFYIGPMEGSFEQNCGSGDPNQWPPEEALPLWRATMEAYYVDVLELGKKVLSLIALGLASDERLFEKLGALEKPMGFIRLLHYPGVHVDSGDEVYGASAHSDYGMITLLATDGVRGLQICREKDKQPHVWEDVPYVKGAFIVNVGDMLERWTNCLFRSTLHRVLISMQERYSIAFFLDPSSNCIVTCLDSCCNESNPARFPPIRSGDYLQERFRITYASKGWK